MSDIPTPLPVNPSLAQLQKRAKERVREARAAGNENATLADAQFAIAREHGFENWAKLKQHIEALRPAGIEIYERLASDLATAYTSGDEKSIRAMNANFGTAFPADFHDPEKVQRHLATLREARQMVAHAYGFENWAKFAAGFTQPETEPIRGAADIFLHQRPPHYTIDWQENRLTARGPQSRKDWEQVFAVVEELGISKLRASGITDDAMKDLADLECVTHLDVSGSNGLTDEGTQHLARMPQLIGLEIGGRHTALTARAFEPLRQLKSLRQFGAHWTEGFTDAAAACLEACDLLESVQAMGSASGDGLIRALAGKAELRYLETGRSVTDAGILALHGIPAFKQWLGGEVRTGLMGEMKTPNRLLIDGDFTDAGVAALTGLEGIAALAFFWHSKGFTASGLEPLRLLPHLEVFEMDGGQCGDDAMRQIAAIPQLRQLQAQGAVAGDAGWEALSHSKTLQYIWGRECPNFGSRGFMALLNLAELRGMGIGCKHVDDDSLSNLPLFPRLRQLVSIGVSDSGFRHVGRCEQLESLYCMYCRDTGDVATEHIRGLKKLQTYYAGMTQITDGSLEILSGMESLEKLEFWQCMSITDAGVEHLAHLPRLGQIEIHGSPGVSEKIRQLLPGLVRVRYSG